MKFKGYITESRETILVLNFKNKNEMESAIDVWEIMTGRKPGLTKWDKIIKDGKYMLKFIGTKKWIDQYKKDLKDSMVEFKEIKKT